MKTSAPTAGARRPAKNDSAILMLAEQGTLSNCGGTGRLPKVHAIFLPHYTKAKAKKGNGGIRYPLVRPKGPEYREGLKMSAIGLSRGKGFRMSVYAPYDHDHLVFARQQSHTLRQMDWEERLPPLQSWSRLLGPWLGLAGIVAIVLPFVI